MEKSFWDFLDELVVSSAIIIDRPAGSAHPMWKDKIYPLDYGYLDGTTTVDGGGVDVWLGSQGGKQISGVLVSVDLFKRDAEIKILVGCTPAEVETILVFLNEASQRAILVKQPDNGEQGS